MYPVMLQEIDDKPKKKKEAKTYINYMFRVLFMLTMYNFGFD